jgi:hypothetical protein
LLFALPFSLLAALLFALPFALLVALGFALPFALLVALAYATTQYNETWHACVLLIRNLIA